MKHWQIPVIKCCRFAASQTRGLDVSQERPCHCKLVGTEVPSELVDEVAWEFQVPALMVLNYAEVTDAMVSSSCHFTLPAVCLQSYSKYCCTLYFLRSTGIRRGNPNSAPHELKITIPALEEATTVI